MLDKNVSSTPFWPLASFAAPQLQVLWGLEHNISCVTTHPGIKGQSYPDDCFSTFFHCQYLKKKIKQNQLCLLPCEAMRKRGLCCRPVSVCLPVMLVHCIRTAKYIIKLLSRPRSPIILVFWPTALVPNSKGNPFSGGAKYKGGGKILRYLMEISAYLRNSTR